MSLDRIAALCAGVMLSVGISQAHAQEEAYPSKPVAIIVPFAANTSIDLIYRLYSQSVLESTGRQFLVNNRTGAAGSIGTAQAAKAPPDGYTLLAATSAFTITPFVYPGLPYDHLKDFIPITMMATQLYAFVANPSAPFRDAREYIALARANPGAINYGTAGAGSSTHLPGALLHHMTGTRVTVVHYKDANQRMVDLIGGRVQVTAATLAAAGAHIKSGRMRALGIASLLRSPLWPDMPTIAEQGVPGYEYSGWNGLAAPAATPAPIVRWLHATFVRASRDPAIEKKLELTGTVVATSMPDEFRQHIVADTQRWRTLIRETGIKLEE